ncbi:GntR family transcriptional regulator [bacterium]|nr:MAG: GntR family transcriptional regulator [bacterium]
MTPISSAAPQAPEPRMDAQSLLGVLEEMSQSLQPGDQLPTQSELIRLYNTSERSVRWALNELRREGKIVSRPRLGTVVAQRPPAQSNGHAGDEAPNSGYVADMVVNSRTIVAIAVPGQTVFSRAMELLFQQTQNLDLPLVCRFFDPQSSIVPSGERPLGYVLFGRDLLPLGKQLQDAGHRVVLVGAPYADTEPDVICVYGDQEHGGYLATRHLLDLGHKRIAFRGGSDWPQMRRWRGHKQALAEARRAGALIEESHIFDEEFEQWRRSPELAAAYFSQPDAPTAIVAWNDQAAMSLLSLLSYVRIRVPQDVSLIGFDNLPESQQVHPALTTIDAAFEQQLRSTVRLLTQPQPASPSQTVIVTSSLVCRESTSAPSK